MEARIKKRRSDALQLRTEKNPKRKIIVHSTKSNEANVEQRVKKKKWLALREF